MSFLDQMIDENPSTKYMPQGSEAWEQFRAGRFTSSEIWKIMEFGTRDMTPEELAMRPKSGPGSRTTKVPDPTKMNVRGQSYIYQKVAEVLTGRPKPSTYAYPLVYGKETEPFAADYFAKYIGCELQEIGFQCFGDHAGGSPDRIFEKDGNKMGLEIKCPFMSENQIQYLLLKEPADLKKNYPEYYWQCVSLMLFCDCNVWHFMTYDPRFQDSKYMMSHLILDDSNPEIKLDQSRVITAIEAAVKMKLEILDNLK